MTHVSKRQLSDDAVNLLKDALLHTFSNLTPQQTKTVLSSLLTPTEITMLAKRLGIVYLLNSGESEANVAEVVKATRQTVARIRLQMEADPTTPKSYFAKKFDTWKKSEELNKLLKDVVKYTARTMIRNIRF